MFRLVRGGFRTVTGQIGKVDHDRYSVVTTQATIGIRGTHYVLQDCVADECRETPDSAPPAGRLRRRARRPRRRATRLSATPNSACANISSCRRASRPQRLIAPPTFLADNLKGRVQRRAHGAGRPAFPQGAGVPAGLRACPARRSSTWPPRTSNLGSLVGTGRNDVVGSDLYTLELGSADAAGQPVHASTVRSRHRDRTATLHASLGSASVVDTGAAPDAGSLNWGRWDGAGLDDRADAAQRPDRTQRRRQPALHLRRAATSLPASGMVSFSPAGGTRPTDSATRRRRHADRRAASSPSTSRRRSVALSGLRSASGPTRLTR